ncbi:MAG: RHS repeat-associated core domain-containing protein [Treponema sp.]|nr:RHS repeat-associated core domain-containing protein [Treponema sp.]
MNFVKVNTMTQSLKTSPKTTLRPLFLRERGFLTHKKGGKTPKIPGAVAYRGNLFQKKFTGKERDPETGLYYYGARYLDPKTSRWISGDPALGEYLPVAPVNDEAKKHNQNLPGMGGVFNAVNMHAYHYAGNNPVVYTDPDGRDIFLLGGRYRETLANINLYSRTQYTVGEGGRLIPTGQINDRGSATYSNIIDDMNNNSSIKVGVMTTTRAQMSNGRLVYPGNYGEGATVPPRGTGEENTWFAGISGRSNNRDIHDQNGNILNKSPAEILIHELVGHVSPQTQGRGYENADEQENVVRGELGLPLVKVRPDHLAETGSTRD